MPRLSIYSELFYGPLTEDVEDLLARFQQTDSIRYEVFSALWREMSFSDIFTGVVSTGEMKRFCRVTMATAMKYFLPPYSYQIRVGALYLMFGFYHTQLAVPPVNVRLALKDWAHVQKFLKDSVHGGHYDVVCIYHKLVAAKAIHYTAMPHFLTFQKQRKPKKDTVCAEFLGRTTAVQELISTEFLDELTNVQSHYDKLKEATVEIKCQVTMAHRDFTTRLSDCVSEFTTWQLRTFSQDSQDRYSGDDEEKPVEGKSSSSSSSRARLLSSIKHKSYSSFEGASKSRRHRHAEVVDSSSSGAEQVRETSRRKKVPSLRARTWKTLGVVQEEKKLQAWLLSAPDNLERLPAKRVNQVVPSKF